MSYEHKDKDKRAAFEAAHHAALKRAKEKAGDHGEHKGDHKWGINLVPFSQRVGSIKRFSALVGGPVATYDLLNPVAGAGQRDLWADGSATGSLVWYFSATDFLYVMDPYNPTTSTTQYSNDGGGTWTTIAYSGGSPTNKGSITGYDGAGNYTALPAGGGDASYKSTDGKTYTKQNAFPGSNGPMSSNVIWYAKNSLFVCCSIIDATHVVCTSSDSGATFVAQTTPSIGTIVPITTFMSLATDGNTIVAALGNVSQNPVIYSTDGTTWSTVSGGPANGDVAVAVSYSSTKGWFLQNSTDGTGYTSSNGTTWTKQPAGWGAAGAISTFWSPEYSTWYMVNTDPDNDLNYTLLATPDPTKYPFQPTSLDGARPATLGYNLGCYMPKYDSFVIGTSDTGGVAGSTSRPRTIKSVGDDIRVRNMPVSCGTYSTYTSKSANSTTSEVTLSNPTSALGSLSFQADQPLGSVIDLDFYCNVTSSAGDTLTLRYKNNGGTMFTHMLTIPSSSSNLGINIRTRMTVASGDIQYNSTATISGSAATILSGTNSWTQQPNTISITGQWGAAASSCTMNQLICTTHFPNGA